MRLARGLEEVQQAFGQERVVLQESGAARLVAAGEAAKGGDWSQPGEHSRGGLSSQGHIARPLERAATSREGGQREAVRERKNAAVALVLTFFGLPKDA